MEELGLQDLPGRERYDRLFEACRGAFIQQSSYWAEAIQALGPDRPFLLLCRRQGEDVAGLPLYHFEHPDGGILTSVPQPGPLGGVFVREGLVENERAEAYAALLEQALALAHRLRCVTLTLITNPFADDLELYERALSPTYVLENYTQCIRLEQPERRSEGQRNNLARARKRGFRVGLCETPAELEDWLRVHQQRRAQLGAAPHDVRLYHDIRGALGPRGKALFVAAWDGERVASSGLYVGHRDVIDVYTISMDADYAAHAPNALVTDFSIAAARARGARVYNWQSSPDREGGVYNYKKQWGSREVGYYFVTKVLGSLDGIRALGRDGVRREYAGHYVLPFQAFSEGFDKPRFRKP